MAKKAYKPTQTELAEAAVAAVLSVTGGNQEKLEQPSIHKRSRRAQKSKSKAADKQTQTADGLLWDLHIKHPPSGPFPFLSKSRLLNFPSLYRDGPVDRWGRIPLDDAYIAYTRYHDPLLVLEAFTFAHREKLYPPMWVLNILYQAFERYLSDQGSSPLEQLLHLKRRTKQGHIFMHRAKRRRNLLLAKRICWYSTLKPCSIEIACGKVAAHWNDCIEKGVRHFGYKLDRRLTTDVLRQQYSRSWRREFMCDESFSSVQEELQAMSQKERAEFVAELDPYEIFDE